MIQVNSEGLTRRLLWKTNHSRVETLKPRCTAVSTVLVITALVTTLLVIKARVTTVTSASSAISTEVA